VLDSCVGDEGRELAGDCPGPNPADKGGGGKDVFSGVLCTPGPLDNRRAT
jgi:hypothetical protein